MKSEKLQEISAKADLIVELNKVYLLGEGDTKQFITEIERIKKSILKDLKELPL